MYSRRKPLSRALLIAPDAAAEKLLAEAAWIIEDELNVKKVEFISDEAGLVTRSCKANFKQLGGRLGKNMKTAAQMIAAFDDAAIGRILKGENKTLTFADGSSCEITAADLIISREQKSGLAVADSDGVTVALDCAITPELEAEGFARELVSKIQNLRKESGFEVSDRIALEFSLSPERRRVVEAFKDYISNETLCVEMTFGEAENGVELEVNGETCKLAVSLRKH